MRGRLVAVALLTVACGGKQTKKTPVPVEARVITAGAELLALLPAGADVLIELDLARLRRNPVVGQLVARAAQAAQAAQGSGGGLGFDPARDVDVLVAAGYDVGDPVAATTVVLVRGAALATPAERGALTDAEVRGAAVDAHTLVFAAPARRAQVLALAAGEGGAALAADTALLARRDEAMPLRAPGATLRLTARLTPAQQIAVAGRLGVDVVPATISAWADVADDFALVAELGAGDPAVATQLAHTVERARDELPLLLPGVLHAHDLLASLRVEAHDENVRVVWVVGPKALGALVARLAELWRVEEPPSQPSHRAPT